MDELKRFYAEKRLALFRKIMEAQNTREGCLWPAVIMLFFVFIIGMLCGCKSTEALRDVTDSIRIEYRERRVFLPDTIFYPLPPQKEFIISPDSESHLENDYAASYAAIKDGRLHHSLSTKPQNIPVPTNKEIIYIDSIIYRNKKVIVIEKKAIYKMYWWQKALCYIGIAALAFSAILLRKKLKINK